MKEIFFKNKIKFAIIVLVTIIIVITLINFNFTSRGFSYTVINGHINNISDNKELCQHYRDAKVDLEKWLTSYGFERIENSTIPNWGVHNIEETEEWYTWYKGSYKNTSEFFVLVYHNDGYQSNSERCEFRVYIDWYSKDFKWNLEKEEGNVYEFGRIMQDWWDNNYDKN